MVSLDIQYRNIVLNVVAELLGALEDLNPLLFYLLHDYFYVNEKKPLIFINGFLKCGGAAWALEDLNPLYVNEKKPLINSGFLMCGGEIGI